MQYFTTRFRRCFGAVALLAGLGVARPVAAQWVVQDTNFANTSTYAQQIDVVSASTVWITGYDGSSATPTPYNNFSRTLNGGTTWTPGTVTPAAGLSWAHLSAVSGTTAWAAMIDLTAGGGELYKTTNGGTSWTRQLAAGFPAASGGYLDAVRMFSATTGIVLGDPLTTTNEFEVYTTTNGGTTWTAVPAASLPNPLTGEYGYTGQMTTQGTTNAWFGTNKGRVYRTTNGGSSWSVAATGLTTINHLAFASATTGLAMETDASTGAYVAMKRTTDGGATWTTVTPTGTVHNLDLRAVPGTTNTFVSAGARTGDYGSSVSTDGGLTWTDLETGVQRTSIGAADVNTVWAGSYTDASGLGGIVKGALPSTPVPSTLNYLWTRRAGGTSDDAALGLATDAAGNSYVVGRYQGALTIGATTLTSAGLYDIYLAKYNAAGTLQWARTAGGTNNDFAVAIAVDPTSGAVVLTGEFGATASFGTVSLSSAGNFDAFVVKYSSAGTVQWGATYGGTGADLGNDVTIDDQGTIYLAGEFSGTMSISGLPQLTSAGGTDVFAMALTSAGTPVWAQRAGGTSDDTGVGVIVTGSGGTVFVTGQFQGTAAFGGSAGSLVSAGGNDMFLTTYNSGDGTAQWARRLGSTGDDGGNSVDVDASGAAYLTGYFAGTIAAGTTTLTSAGAGDVLVAKYSAGGTVQWAQRGGGTGSDSGFRLVTDAAGNATVTGVITGAATFGTTAVAGSGQDGFLARYSSTGTLLDADPVGGTGQEVGFGLTLDASGNTYLAGAFSGSLTLGATATLTSAGGTDGFLAKLGTSCTLTAPTVAASAATLCAGQTLTLTGTGIAGGTTVRWTGPNGFVATTATATVANATPAASGAYTLTVTSAAQGCAVSATTAAVTVNAAPAAPVATATFQRCGAGTFALSVTATGATAYAWYTTPTGGSSLPGGTGATYATSVLTATTTYYVSASNANGCTSVRTPVTATVNALPAVSLTAAGPTTFCAGGSVQLTAGGTAGVSYEFFLNGQSLAGPNANPSISAGIGGVYTVVATTPATGCQATSAPVTVTVNPAASAAFGYPATTLCLGGAGTTPTVSGTAGGTFSVSPATGLTVNSGTGAITLAGSVAGTYAVSYSVGGQCPATASQVITVTAAPTAGFAYAQASYCAGTGSTGPPTLTVGATAGSFSSSNGLSIDPFSGIISLSASQPGTYTVINSVAASGSCPAALATTGVTITATPAVPTISLALVGGLIQLTSSAPAGNQWYLNGTAIAGATNPTYTITAAAQNGTYTVMSTVAGCASGVSTGQNITITGTAAELAPASLALYPNPTADGRVTLTLLATATATALTVLDGAGRVVLRAALPAGITRYELDAHRLPAGLYAVRVGSAVRRLVRE